MNNNDVDPSGAFGYSWLTYAWVLLLSIAGGIVKYVNSNEALGIRVAIRDVITAAFTGLVTFWVCEYYSINGPMQAVFIAVFAVMGNRAWIEIENMVLIRLRGVAGIPTEAPTAQPVQSNDEQSIAPQEKDHDK